VDIRSPQPCISSEMRHYIDLMEAVADALHAEAKYRQEHGGIPPAPIQALWRHYKIPPLKSAWVRVFHWPDWTLVTLLGRGERTRGRMIWTEKGFITVYFGAAPEHDTNPARSEKDCRKTIREMREVLRLREFPANTPTNLFKDQPGLIAPGKTPSMSGYKVLVINGATPIETIKEQLAVLCFQMNFADESLWNYLRTRQRSEDVLLVILKKFTDPSHPGSYGDFVGRIRRATSRKTWERKAPALSSHPLGMTVSEASISAGTARSTLYDMIDAGKLNACRDERGVLRIPTAEMSGLRPLIDKKPIWKQLIEIKARTSSLPAARRWVQRARKKGLDPKDVLKRLGSAGKQDEG